jgi:hypothetical protein
MMRRSFPSAAMSAFDSSNVLFVDLVAYGEVDDARVVRAVGDRPQEADLRWHLAQSLRSFSGNDCRG